MWLYGDFQIYTPHSSFILGSSLLLIYMAQVVSTMVQRLTALTCKYIKARPKKKGLQKCVLRGIVSVFHFFDAWTFPSADIYLNNANEQGFQKREQVGQISVLPFQ